MAGSQREAHIDAKLALPSDGFSSSRGSPPSANIHLLSTTPQSPAEAAPRRESWSRSHLPNGIYHIINATTGAYAALLSDTDRLEVVNITFNLNDDDNRGSQWSITHLRRDQYKIQNVDHSSFAGYDTGPRVEDAVLGKMGATTWTIRLAQSPRTYTVSPTGNPDLFWMSLSEVHGTPLEFGQPGTARRCRWTFKAVGSPTESQPDYLYASCMHDLNSLLEGLPTVPSARYDADLRPRCVKGTRVELLQDIRNWVTNPASTPIFWLRGRAGTGKTTVSLTVADECDRQKQLGASFIFSRDQTERSELCHVFPTIAQQLARLHEPYKALLAEALSNDTAFATLQPSLLLERLIVEPLGRCESFPSPVIVVIDALDECKDRNPVSTLLDILSQHIDRLRQLKFFVTSRPEPHIEAVFAADLESETTSITLHDIETTKVDADIALFVRTALTKGAKAYPELIREGWPLEKDVIELVKRSCQLFIFASTVARAIFDDECGDPKGRLAEILSSETSASMSGEALDELDNLYLCTLQTAFSDQLRPEATERLRRILGTILTIADPLSPDRLERLLGLAQGRVRAALRRLHSILVVQGTDAGPIRLIHPSFFDFLTMRCKDDRFRIDAQSHHRYLAIHCFEVMRAELKRNVCQLSDSSVLNKEVQGLEDRISLFIPPPLRYASQHWALHLCGSVGDEVLEPLERFSSTQMLYWIEVLSLLGLLREGADRLYAAQSFLESQFPERSQIINIFRDGRRFISIYYEVISSSALHIYISAFGLLPRSSLLRQTYEEHIQGCLRVVAGDTRDNTVTKLGGGRRFYSSSFSPNGAYVSALTNIEIYIWHTATSSLFSIIKSDHQPIWAQFLPDSAYIVCGYTNLTLAIWDIQSTRSVDTISLQQCPNPPVSVRYAADAQFSILGVLLDHKILRLWDTRTWQLRQEHVIMYESHHSTDSQRVVSFRLAAVSSQALHIAAVLSQNTVHILQIHPDSIECRPLDVDGPSCCAISSHGRQLAVGTQACTVVVWDTQTRQLLRSYTHKGGPLLRAAAFVDNDAYVLFAARSILLWSLADGKSTRMGLNLGNISDITSSKDGRLAFTNVSGVFLSEGNQTETNSIDWGFNSHVPWRFTPDGSYVVSERHDMDRVGLLHTETEKMEFLNLRVACTASSPDSRYIVIGQRDGTVALYSLETKGNPRRLYKHQYGIVSVGSSHDGSMVISADWRGVVCIWDIRNQRLLHWFELLHTHLEQPLGHLSPSPIQRLLARLSPRSPPRLEMPSASSLPSPIWRVGNTRDSQLWQDSADVWGFRSIRLNAYNFEDLLYCKSRATGARVVAACGATNVRIHCGAGPPILDITTSQPKRIRGDRQSQRTVSTKVPLHCHIVDNWILACHGSEASRFAWLPFEWRPLNVMDVPILNISNRSMLVTTRNGTQVLLNLTGLSQDLTATT